MLQLVYHSGIISSRVFLLQTCVALNEMVAINTFFSDIPAADDGLLDHGVVTMVQVYVGYNNLLTRTFPMQRELCPTRKVVNGKLAEKYELFNNFSLLLCVG